MNHKPASPSPSAWALLILALAAAMYGLRLVSPSDLEGYAQYRNVGYVLDTVHHGHWLTQHDLQGRILSKPPLHTWLIAASVHAFGENRFALTLPSFIAVSGLGLLVFTIGRRRFGLLAGAFAGIFVVLAPLYSKQIAMVRSDPIFALFITTGMWMAWKAWREGGGWTLFWFVGALGTLTKGPLAVLLAGIGLVSWFWEKRARPDLLKPRGPQWTGLLVFFAICLAWLVPALIRNGRELVDMMLVGELIGQASGVNNHKIPLSNFPEPTLNLLSRFAPFSLLAFYGIWCVFRRPALNEEERGFERFLACAALGGLLVFSVAAHFRSDLILPLWAPCALLAGREAARLREYVGRTSFAWGLVATTAALFAFAWWTYNPAHGPRAHLAVYSEDTKAAAAKLLKSGIPVGEIAHIGTPATFQFYLGTANRWIASDQTDIAADLTEKPRWLAVGDTVDEVTLDRIKLPSRREIFRWPEQSTRPPVVRLYELDW